MAGASTSTCLTFCCKDHRVTINFMICSQSTPVIICSSTHVQLHVCGFWIGGRSGVVRMWMFGGQCARCLSRQ
eukprot:5699546-Amphidinium_carterae.2